jgi:hypothetical protein
MLARALWKETMKAMPSSNPYSAGLKRSRYRLTTEEVLVQW